MNIISRRIQGCCNGFNTFRDVDHPGKDMGSLYAQDVKNICDKLTSKGMKPACFIAESLQSCGGNRKLIKLHNMYFVCLLSHFCFLHIMSLFTSSVLSLLYVTSLYDNYMLVL